MSNNKRWGVLVVEIFTYGLIGFYAVLTGVAGIHQLKENGFQVQSILFIVVSSGILGMLFIPNKDWMLVLLLLAFVLLQILAVVQGVLSNGRLTYTHHIVRFLFHCILVLLVYKFIK
ncbi:hypothetical protein [Sporosarcina thermotolerans]|uniref:hypothetical protein n=1 Tax=Sporosarcina thermotolerans TaxID=633404 RepID=UPI0036D2B026